MRGGDRHGFGSLDSDFLDTIPIFDGVSSACIAMIWVSGDPVPISEKRTLMGDEERESPECFKVE